MLQRQQSKIFWRFWKKTQEAGEKCVLHNIVQTFCDKEEDGGVLTSLYKEEYTKYTLEQLQQLGISLSLSISKEDCDEIEKTTRMQTKSKK